MIAPGLHSLLIIKFYIICHMILKCLKERMQTLKPYHIDEVLARWSAWPIIGCSETWHELLLKMCFCSFNFVLQFCSYLSTICLEKSITQDAESPRISDLWGTPKPNYVPISENYKCLSLYAIEIWICCEALLSQKSKKYMSTIASILEKIL